MKSIVSTILLSLTVIVSGCSCRYFSAPKKLSGQRTIQATVKITTPEKIITAPVFIAFLTDKSLRIDIRDVFGITQAAILADSRHMQLYSMADRCRAVKKSWVSKLAYTSGAAIKYERLITWLFPVAWPENPVTYRFFLRKNQIVDIVQYPLTSSGNGRVMIDFPAESIKISMTWNDDQEVLFSGSAMKIAGDWRDCEDFSFFDMVFQ